MLITVSEPLTLLLSFLKLLQVCCQALVLVGLQMIRDSCSQATCQTIIDEGPRCPFQLDDVGLPVSCIAISIHSHFLRAISDALAYFAVFLRATATITGLTPCLRKCAVLRCCCSRHAQLMLICHLCG